MPTFKALLSCDMSVKQLLFPVKIQANQRRRFYYYACNMFMEFIDLLVKETINKDAEIYLYSDKYILRLDWIKGEEFKQRAKLGLIEGVDYLANNFTTARVVVHVATGKLHKSYTVYGGPKIKEQLLEKINKGRWGRKPIQVYAKDYYDQIDCTKYRMTPTQRNKLFNYGLRRLCRILRAGGSLDLKTDKIKYIFGTIYYDTLLAHQRMVRALREKINHLETGVPSIEGEPGYFCTFKPLHKGNETELTNVVLDPGERLYRNFYACRLRNKGIKYFYQTEFPLVGYKSLSKWYSGVIPKCKFIGEFHTPSINEIMKYNKLYGTVRDKSMAEWHESRFERDFSRQQDSNISA